VAYRKRKNHLFEAKGRESICDDGRVPHECRKARKRGREKRSALEGKQQADPERRCLMRIINRKVPFLFLSFLGLRPFSKTKVGQMVQPETIATDVTALAHPSSSPGVGQLLNNDSLSFLKSFLNDKWVPFLLNMGDT